ncbi:hypothetical protein [Lignipirellula cremea]|uniref:Uncharacterized protein n=1 Tax=Lignipirellula cremea TaxID=2528010 RepID=A0A518DVM8_9BACT|nr:hypothetical protein [Lignipirellula cremea]QDU95890.1 hypothetical protein Pla8534_37090 [Lignipirellula cremea]
MPDNRFLDAVFACRLLLLEDAANTKSQSSELYFDRGAMEWVITPWRTTQPCEKPRFPAFENFFAMMLFPIIAFVVFLVAGRILEELTWGDIGFLLVAAVVVFLSCIILDLHPMFFSVALSLADIGLLLWIFNGDLTIR